MNVGKTLYASNRKQWRSWLSKNHRKAADIWLIYFKKGSGKKRIPYNDAVEEALCYGWIDSIAKPRDNESWVQRFTPRRKGSPLSELNKERVRRLIKAKKMTRYGLDTIRHHLDKKPSGKTKLKEFTLPQDILHELRSDPAVWENFEKFSVSYKRIRIGWIDGVRRRPDVFRQRLRYFIKMTAQNKKFGTIQ